MVIERPKDGQTSHGGILIGLPRDHEMVYFCPFYGQKNRMPTGTITVRVGLFFYLGSGKCPNSATFDDAKDADQPFQQCVTGSKFLLKGTP